MLQYQQLPVSKHFLSNELNFRFFFYKVHNYFSIEISYQPWKENTWQIMWNPQSSLIKGYTRPRKRQVNLGCEPSLVSFSHYDEIRATVVVMPPCYRSIEVSLFLASAAQKDLSSSVSQRKPHTQWAHHFPSTHCH